MKRLKAIAGITAIFALGIMTGVLGTGLLVEHRIESFHEKGFRSIRPMFMKKIGKQLDLTPAQRVEVDKILVQLRSELREIRQGFRPKIKSAFDNSFEQIKTNLTEPQKKKLDILKKELPPYSFSGKKFKKRKGKHREHRDHREPPQEKIPLDDDMPDRS